MMIRESVTTTPWRRFGWLMTLLMAVGLWIGDSRDATAQRLLDRLRSRIEPLVNPPESDRPTQRRWSDSPFGDAGPSDVVRPSQSEPPSPQPEPPFGTPAPGTVSPMRPQGPPGGRTSAEDAAPPTIGIAARPAMDWVTGVQVLRFYPHSLAGAAGLLPGDLIISVEGNATPSVADIGRILRPYRVGDEVRLTVVRRGNVVALQIPLVAPAADLREESFRDFGDLPARPDEFLPPQPGLLPWLRRPPAPQDPSRPGDLPTSPDSAGPPDSSVGPPTKADDPFRAARPPEPGRPPVPGRSPEPSDDSRRLGVDVVDAEASGGAVVTQVTPDSAASRSGLRPEDRIVAVEGRVVRRAEDLRNQVARLSPEQPFRIQVLRGDQLIEIESTLAPPADPDPSGRLPPPAEGGDSGPAAGADAPAGGGAPAAAPTPGGEGGRSFLQGLGSAFGELLNSGPASPGSGDGPGEPPSPPAETLPEPDEP